MNWIESGGGPLVLMDGDFMLAWHGTDVVGASGPSDYDRACAVDDYCQTIPVDNNAKAVVLGDEPTRTAIARHDDQCCMLIRWRWAPSELDILRAIANIEGVKFNATPPMTIHLPTGRIVMFDAAFPGGQAPDILDADLLPGTYEISTALYEPHEELSLILHKIRRTPVA